MLRNWRTFACAVFTVVVVGPAVAQDTAPGGLSGGATPPPATDSEVLAQGVGGAFTRDAADAYIESRQAFGRVVLTP